MRLVVPNPKYSEKLAITYFNGIQRYKFIYKEYEHFLPAYMSFLDVASYSYNDLKSIDLLPDISEKIENQRWVKRVNYLAPSTFNYFLFKKEYNDNLRHLTTLHRAENIVDHLFGFWNEHVVGLHKPLIEMVAFDYLKKNFSRKIKEQRIKILL